MRDGHWDRGNRLRDLFWKIYPAYWARPLVKRDVASYVKWYARVGDLYSKPYYQTRERSEKLRHELRNGAWTRPMSRMGMWSSNVQILYSRYLANVTGFESTMALRMHKVETGSYPDALSLLVPDYLSEATVDPFSGKGMIYRKDGRGFIVYSIGQNGKDDGGPNKTRDSDDIGWSLPQ